MALAHCHGRFDLDTKGWWDFALIYSNAIKVGCFLHFLINVFVISKLRPVNSVSHELSLTISELEIENSAIWDISYIVHYF